MQKIIANVTNNNFNALGKKCRLKINQKQKIKELGAEILKKGTLILRHLTPEKSIKTAKEYGKTMGNILEKIEIKKEVEKKILSEFCKNIKTDEVIGYDLTDEIHPYSDLEAKAGMENNATVFDGSRRRREKGFFLHGVGTTDFLLRLESHASGKEFLPQKRKEILEEILPVLRNKGIWAFDRGNDDEKLFSYLNEKAVKFIVRLKENRKICICETGEITNVKDLKAGRYEVYVRNSGGFKKGKTNGKGFNTENKYILLKKEHLKNKKPILMICSRYLEKLSDEELIEKYLKRWGVETQFRKVKQLYMLESVQIRNWKRRENLLALVLFVHFLNRKLQNKLKIAKDNAKKWALETWLCLKKFLKKKSKTYNAYSFTEFIRTQIPEKLCFYLRSKNTVNHFKTTQIKLFN